jgi:hypothetical protein
MTELRADRTLDLISAVLIRGKPMASRTPTTESTMSASTRVKP